MKTTDERILNQNQIYTYIKCEYTTFPDVRVSIIPIQNKENS